MLIDVVVLAAGKGTRMRSNMPKVLHALGGKPMVQHVVDAVQTFAETNNYDAKTNLVIGHGADQVRDVIKDVEFVDQQEQLGTGHAVAQALPLLRSDSMVLILYGDVPLIQVNTLERLISAASTGMGLITALLDDPTGYGRIVRENGCIKAIVEQKDASEEQKAIQEINTGIMAVPQTLLSKWLPNLSNENAQGEYYLTDVIAMAANEGVSIEAVHPLTNFETEGVNNKKQLAALERSYQLTKADALMDAGATIADPARIDIRGSVTVGQDVYIDVNTVFEGDCHLEDGVYVGPNAVVINSRVATGTRVEANCVLDNANVGTNNTIGPYARLRPGMSSDDGVKVGNFVEVKKSKLGKGSKANHLAYIGDAEVGSNTNIGAGTITCNYDGANKFKTELGNHVFIGSNSTLVAPLQVEDGAFVGAGSTITATVKKEELAVGRSKQRNIKGWRKPTKK